MNQKDPVECLATTLFSNDEEKSSFPFHDLPLLVQLKILREYVPVLTKIYVLGKLPEFSDLLRCRSSWWDTSETFSRLVPLFRLLRRGFYVISKDLPDHGYYVSIEWENTISLTLCGISRMVWHFPIDPGILRCSTASVPPSNLYEFLTLFLKHYILAPPVLAYRYRGLRTFFVNRSANAVMWDDCETYTFDQNECVINPKYDYFGSIRFTLNDNDRVKLRFEKSVTKNLQEKCKPISLESCILDDFSFLKSVYEDDWDNPVPFRSRICEFRFKFEKKDRISVCLKFRNLHACWYYRNEDLFNAISKDIIKIFTVRNQ